MYKISYGFKCNFKRMKVLEKEKIFWDLGFDREIVCLMIYKIKIWNIFFVKIVVKGLRMGFNTKGGSCKFGKGVSISYIKGVFKIL